MSSATDTCPIDTALLAAVGASTGMGIAGKRGHHYNAHYQNPEYEAKRVCKLKAQHELEWKYFDDCRRHRLRKMHATNAENSFRLMDTLSRAYSGICSAHKEEAKAHMLLVRKEEMRRPLVLSPLAATVRAIQERLEPDKQYKNGDALRRLFDTLRQSEEEVAAELKEKLIERKIRGKRREHDTKKAFARRKVAIIEQLAAQQEEMQARATKANLQHKEEQMAAAHRKQLLCHQFPSLRAGAFSKTQGLMAERGTQLKKQQYGDHYHVPSLCEMYGRYLA
ncbi:hypothetical protein ERJ75_001339900 [Trypanosoma vivax]|uniref:Uncharacterized protein n=1 Tax=Trypanosoma vivax (strain Y486) TaxID=1055687 RepID=G0U672_TRYVY|nr:hypothetical protein ERJ75_001339900 [Trypanosoma vivax]CCC51375.1 conserved hypothetical protein [Trypanosoma vivax Y486]